MRKKLHDPAFRQRTSRLYYSWLRRWLDAGQGIREATEGLDYVMAVAEKPEPAELLAHTA
jgi:hypothetical protein